MNKESDYDFPIPTVSIYVYSGVNREQYGLRANKDKDCMIILNREQYGLRANKDKDCMIIKH
jgi:hypothetical protein